MAAIVAGVLGAVGGAEEGVVGLVAVFVRAMLLVVGGWMCAAVVGVGCPVVAVAGKVLRGVAVCVVWVLVVGGVVVVGCLHWLMMRWIQVGLSGARCLVQCSVCVWVARWFVCCVVGVVAVVYVGLCFACGVLASCLRSG